MEVGTDLAAAAASAAASLGLSDKTETTSDTGADTSTDAGHTPTPAADESDSHIQWLKDNYEKIPADKVSFLDKKFQPDYTRKLNLLNTDKQGFQATRQGFEQNAEAILSEAGVKIPDGKSVSDLMFEDNGKPFLELLKGTVKEQMAPLMEQVNLQKTNHHISSMMNLAQERFPEVKENLKEVLAMIDSDPELMTLGTQTNVGANALPYVMRGAALAIKVGKQEAEIAELKKRLGIATTANRVGTSTSKASGGAAKPSEQKPTKLADFAKLALERVKESV